MLTAATVDLADLPMLDAIRTSTNAWVRMRGDSFLADGIRDGDYLVLSPRYAEDGDVVVARLDADRITVRRLHRTTRGLCLRPVHAATPVVELIDEAQVEGVLVGLVRSYRSEG